LHSPHQGSSVADLATTIHNWLSSLVVPWFLGDLLRFLDSFVNSPGNQELRTDSAFLADLRNRETTPLPVNIAIHTLGGTSSRLSRVRAWWFDWMSAVPLWHWPPFHWQTWPGAITAWGPYGPITISTALDEIPWLSQVVPEAGMGVGDTLVTDTRSRLPFEPATHQLAQSRPSPVGQPAQRTGTTHPQDTALDTTRRYRVTAALLGHETW
jgi:hypothetical protein